MNAGQNMQSISIIGVTKYLRFFEWAEFPKARNVGVWSKYGRCWLGNIAWHGPFRRYSFTPLSDTVYEQDCLRAIANMCEQMTREHKARQKGT